LTTEELSIAKAGSPGLMRRACLLVLVWLIPALGCDARSRGPGPMLGDEPRRPPPWLEQPLPDGFLLTPPGGPVFTVGVKAALAGKGMVAALHLERGLIGYLKLPADTMWAGLANGDEVLAATRSGVLYVADSLDAAVDGVFSVRSATDQATLWDASQSLVVAAAHGAVQVSTDGGRTFKRSMVAPGPIVQVLVRSPGTVVVIQRGQVAAASAAISVSLDGGKTWRLTSYARPSVTRFGGWIVDSMSARFSVMDPCAVVLDDQGSWRTVPRSQLDRPTQALAAWPEGTSSAAAAYRGPARPLTVADAASVLGTAPVKRPCRAAQARAERPEAEAEASEERGPSAQLGALLAIDEPGVGTRTSFALADDGICSSVDGGVCTGELLRAPAVVVRDFVLNTVEVVRPPDGCTPWWLQSARGLGVLSCRTENYVDLYTIDRARRWAREARLPAWVAGLDRLATADDGTILLADDCDVDGRCRVLCRNPADSGAAGAWWVPELDGAVAYRPLRRGRVLAVEAADAAGGTLVTLSILASGRPSQRVARLVVPDPLETVAVRGGVAFVNEVQVVIE